MKTTTAIRAGLAFGVAAIAGGAIAVAFDGNSDRQTSPTFSTARLAILQDDTARVPDATAIGLGDPILEYLSGAPVYLAAQANGITAYVAELKDGTLCVLAASAGDGVAMTCGTSDMAGSGNVALRTQNRPDDPSYFVGIAPNDATGVRVDDQAGVVDNNVFIAVGKAKTDTYTITGDGGKQSTIDMAIDQVPKEAQQSG
jgi:hypothetical protein